MRRLVITLLLLVMGAAWSVGVAPCAQACSCAPPDAERELRSDLVVEATVRDMRVEGGERVFELEVHRAWRGTTEAEIELRTGLDTPACGLALGVGTRYVVFAHATPKGWSAGWCGGTFAVGASDPVVPLDVVEARLGQGTVLAPAPVPSPPASPGSPDATDGSGLRDGLGLAGLALGAVVALGLVGGAAALALGRRSAVSGQARRAGRTGP